MRVRTLTLRSFRFVSFKECLILGKKVLPRLDADPEWAAWTVDDFGNLEVFFDVTSWDVYLALTVEENREEVLATGCMMSICEMMIQEAKDHDTTVRFAGHDFTPESGLESFRDLWIGDQGWALREVLRERIDASLHAAAA